MWLCVHHVVPCCYSSIVLMPHSLKLVFNGLRYVNTVPCNGTLFNANILHNVNLIINKLEWAQEVNKTAWLTCQPLPLTSTM